MFRQGDPSASTSVSPVDFFSPDTVNYITFDIASDGLLSVDAWGIPSYQQNIFPQDPVDVARIFGFQIGLATTLPEPSSLVILAGLAGITPPYRVDGVA